MTAPCHYLLLMTLWGRKVSASLKMFLPAIQLVLVAVAKVKLVEEREFFFFFNVKIGTCFVKAVYLCALFKLDFCHNPRWTELLCKVLLPFLLLRRWNWISKAEIILLIENALYVLDVSFSSFFFPCFLFFFPPFLKNVQLHWNQRTAATGTKKS